MKVQLEQVSFSYRRKSVIQDVSWSFGHGVTGLLGPNGAGKTTLLSLLVTLLRPQAGTIKLDEHDLSKSAGRAAARRALGFVPQRFSLAPEMQVHDTVAYAAWVHGVPDRKCDAAASRALEDMGLAAKAADRVRTLSGGERQRLGLAAALAHDPTVLVLDEPTVGLDPGQLLRLRERIAEVSKVRTVIIASHLMEDIEQLCQRVGVLVDGRLAFAGSTDELHALVDGAEVGNSALGSRFERAYDALITRLGTG